MLIRRVLFVVVIAAFACAAVANGLDRVSRDVTGVERLVPVPFRAQANRSAASAALDRKDYAAALANSRNAVVTDPVDPDAAASLASALMQVGRTSDAERTFRIAARFGWRNVQTQAFWYDAALQAGDYPVAAERLDALLRVHTRLVDQAELLKPMESDPSALKALVERLKLGPPWLGAYLRLDDDTPSDVLDRRLAVMAALNASRFSMGCDGVEPFAHALLTNGRRSDAETLWNANCPTMKVTGLISDPTFAHVLDPNAQNPFSWRVMSSGDLSIRQVPGSGGSKSLSLSNSAPGTRLILDQTVALPPGVYHFHASGPEGQANAGKLYISWGCNGRPPFPETSAGDLFGSGEDIHVSQCDRQQIGLWIGGGGAQAALASLQFEKTG